jgi:pimeloyl-ACP methyl ester carboxylesterase
MGNMKRTVRRGALFFMLFVGLLLAAAALLEWSLEKRDAARLGATETFAQLGPSRVRYRLEGADKPGSPVVLLHGSLASADQWEDVQRDLARTHPVLAYDRGGLGLSEGAAVHTGVEQARELAQLLDALHINRAAIVVSYSFSAMQARLFADQYPQRTASLVFLDPYFPEYPLLAPGRHGNRRRYARTYLSGCLKALFGIARLQEMLAEPGPDTVEEAHNTVFLSSFRYWWAAAQEWWATDDTRRQTMATHGPLPPLIVLSSPIDEGDPIRQVLSRLVDRSARGKVRFLPESEDHGALLEDPAVRQSVAAAVDELAAL